MQKVRVMENALIYWGGQNNDHVRQTEKEAVDVAVKF